MAQSGLFGTERRLLRDVEAELDDVAVADGVFFALQADVAVLFGRLHRSLIGQQVVVVDHLGANKATLEVGVNLTGGGGRLHALGYRPRAHLVFARREE